MQELVDPSFTEAAAAPMDAGTLMVLLVNASVVMLRTRKHVFGCMVQVR
jgi:hypothetical protein